MQKELSNNVDMFILRLKDITKTRGEAVRLLLSDYMNVTFDARGFIAGDALDKEAMLKSLEGFIGDKKYQMRISFDYRDGGGETHYYNQPGEKLPYYVIKNLFKQVEQLGI